MVYIIIYIYIGNKRERKKSERKIIETWKELEKEEIITNETINNSNSNKQCNKL